MFNVSIAFEILDSKVKDIYCTTDPKGLNYAGVVSLEIICIALTYAALNDLQITTAEVYNVYIHAPSSEKKHFVVCNNDIGIENKDKVNLIQGALYRGNLVGHNY